MSPTAPTAAHHAFPRAMRAQYTPSTPLPAPHPKRANIYTLPTAPPAQAMRHSRRPSEQPPEATDNKHEFYRPNRCTPRLPASHACPIHPTHTPASPTPKAGPDLHLLPTAPPAQAMRHSRRPSEQPPEATDNKHEPYCPNRCTPRLPASHACPIHPTHTPASPTPKAVRIYGMVYLLPMAMR